MNLSQALLLVALTGAQAFTPASYGASPVGSLHWYCFDGWTICFVLSQRQVKSKSKDTQQFASLIWKKREDRSGIRRRLSNHHGRYLVRSHQPAEVADPKYVSVWLASRFSTRWYVESLAVTLKLIDHRPRSLPIILKFLITYTTSKPLASC